MATAKKTVSKKTTSSNVSALTYKAKKQFEAGVRASTTAALKKPATVAELAKRMKIKATTANNLVRWLVWNGYVTRA